MTIPGPVRASSPVTSAQRGLPIARPLLTGLAVISLLGAAGCAGADTADTRESQVPAAPSTPSSAPTEGAADDASDTAASSDQAYTDGTYTQTGSYQSPAGPEEVGVTLTLEADVVSGVEVEPMPSNPTTREYQGRFAGGIADTVVGKKLDELSVDKVAGSSLTSGGFNDALGKIKSEAQL